VGKHSHNQADKAQSIRQCKFIGDQLQRMPNGLLVLHLDVNKTLIMSDGASGKSDPKAMINSLLTEAVWGSIRSDTSKETRTVDDWTLECVEPCVNNPDPAGTWVTFNDFLEVHSLIPKSVYKPLKQMFTEPGRIGECCRPYYAELLAALTVSSGEISDCPRLHFILPSVFYMIEELTRRGVDFAIIFRTFGHDIRAFAQDWNLFVSGSHPTHPLSNPLPHLHLRLPHDSCALVRSGTPGGPDEDVFLSHVEVDVGVDKSDSDGIVRIIRGAGAVKNTLIGKFDSERKRRALFLQDDYAYWANHGEADNAGKLLLLDPHEVNTDTSQAAKVHQLFVDDNIERHRAHIVDVRMLQPKMDTSNPQQQKTPDTLALGFEISQPFLLRAEPIEAITCREYFISKLESRGFI